MNERIEQLANQAGMLRDKYGLYWNAQDNPDDGVDLEKFAELIVQECAHQLDDGAEDGMWARGVLYRHFGVE
jgi:hypothetical protein